MISFSRIFFFFFFFFFTHIHVSILFQIRFPLSYYIILSRVPWTIQQSLFVHFKYNSVYMSTPNSLIIPSPHSYPLVVTINSFSNLWVCFCFVNKFICIICFKILHIRDIIRYFSFSDFLHSIWQSLGPFMLLQMALFHSY